MCQRSTQHGKVATKTSINSTNLNGSFSYSHHRLFTSPIQSKQMGFNSNQFTHIVCICSSKKGKISQKCFQAYLSGIFVHKGGSAGISVNMEQTVNTNFVMKHALTWLFSNPFHPQGNSGF